MFVSPSAPLDVTWATLFGEGTQLAERGGEVYQFEADKRVMVFSGACLFSRIDIPRRRERACFPGEARVVVKGRGKVRVDEVAVGELVDVGGRFERVVGFSHRERRAVSRFVRLVFVNGAISVSEGHFVYAGGRLVVARGVVPGDVMVVGGVPSVVVEMGKVWGVGLYNLHTEGGDVVVDDVLVSCYTEAVPVAVAQALLAPVRFGAWGGLDLLARLGIFGAT